MMDLVKQALAAYGATLTPQNHIESDRKVSGVVVVIKGKRLRFEANGSLLASGPVSASTVEKFVESFWFWEKK